MTNDKNIKNCVISLQGKDHNTQGIGARIIATYDDGLKVTKEIKAGSGYLSQSTAKVFFSTNSRKIINFKVNWPNGESTEHPIEEEHKNFTLKQS